MCAQRFGQTNDRPICAAGRCSRYVRLCRCGWRRKFPTSIFVLGTDYFENLCLKAGQACKNTRNYQNPRIGVSDEKVAQYAGLHYYTDKELQVTSEPACRLACEIETEFLCRSFLFLGQPQGTQYNCRLYHLDHKTLPDGPSTYLNAERPLIDHGEPTGQYFENQCESKMLRSGTETAK